MKTLPAVILTSFISSAVTATIVVVGMQGNDASENSSVTIAPGSGASDMREPQISADTAPAQNTAVADRLRSMEQLLEDLDFRTKSLEARDRRQPVESPELLAAKSPSDGDLPLEEREQLMTVVQATIEADRERRDQERDEQAAQFNLEESNERAAAIAAELGLGAADETELANVLFEESQKRHELFKEMRSGLASRDDIRDKFDEIRAWKDEEMGLRLGATTAELVRELDDDRRGGPGRGNGGGRRGGDGGGGSDNNGGGGGRGRRG